MRGQVQFLFAISHPSHTSRFGRVASCSREVCSSIARLRFTPHAGELSILQELTPFPPRVLCAGSARKVTAVLSRGGGSGRMVVSSFERIDGTPVVGVEAQQRSAWSTARRLQVDASPPSRHWPPQPPALIFL